MALCKKCARQLTADEIAVYRRLADMKATEYLCIDCLAEYFGCTVELLEEKIKHFRAMGCFLFEDGAE